MNEQTPEGFNTISKSRIDTFKTCPRKFWYKYAAGHRTPGSYATDRGGKVHRELEAYLKAKKDKLETVEAIAAQQRGLIPENRQCLMIEESWPDIVRIKISGLLLNGEADLIYKNESGDIVIRDWKTRSRPQGSYVPGADEIDDNLQLNLYAYGAAHIFESEDEFVVEHVNMKRKDEDDSPAEHDPETYLVQGRVSRSDVFEYVESLKPTIQEMKEVYKMDNPAGVEKNTDSCYKYGGPCHFKTESSCGDDCGYEGHTPCDDTPFDISKAGEDLELDL